MTGNDIGWAVARMKAGHRVTRPGWNGKGMYLWLCKGVRLPTGELSEPFVAMHTAQGTEQPGWLCAQPDLLATDWELVVD